MTKRIKPYLPVLILSASLLGGCAAPVHETLSYESRRLPYSETESGREYSIFFATSRTAAAPGSGPLRFGDKTGSDSTLGLYTAQLDDRLSAAGNKTNSWTGTRISRIETHDDTELFRKLEDAIDASPDRSLLIVVFGYKESFETAALKTAVFAYRVDINTPVLLFDWPGDQGVTPIGYKKAFRLARQSGPHLGDLIARISSEIQPDNLWMTGNSVGAQIICDSFSHMMKAPEMADPEHEIRHVILAAPDVARKEFDTTFSKELDALSDRLTVYTSSDDSALLLSRWIHRNPRLGRGKIPDPEQLEEMEDLLALKADGADSISLVDFTRVNRSSHGHNYYIESSEYFDDFYQRLKGSFPYTSRRRHATRDNNGVLYWVLFSDHDRG
jgi:esterase/lipase superfamily enzyme